MAKSKKAFVDAVRARGGVRYFDLGGGVTPVGSPTLAPQNTAQQGSAGGALAGAGAGAAVGAGLGSVVPGVGTAVGGALGAVAGAAPGLAGFLTPQNNYQAQLAPTQNLDYTNLIGQAANNSLAGYGQQQGNINSEQALQQQLLAEGRGEGPNPAQAALNKQTGINVANQAALMADQRGGSVNAGLIARQAAQQGAATQQQAVGESATLQAQQQLAAQQGAAALQGQVGNQISNEQSANNQLLGAGAGATNTQNANLISNYGMAQGLNQSTAQGNAAATQKTAGGIFGGIGGILGGLFAEGGKVGSPESYKHLDAMHYAEGGAVSWAGRFLNSSPLLDSYAVPNTGVSAPTHTTSSYQSSSSNSPEDSKTSSDLGKKFGSTLKSNYGDEDGGVLMGRDASLMASGGKVKSMVSPGEKILPPNKVNSSTPLKDATPVPGKAKVQGNSLKNDVVPADLPVGAIVLPRSVTQAKDAPRKAADFVKAIQAKQGLKRKAKSNG